MCTTNMKKYIIVLGIIGAIGVICNVALISYAVINFSSAQVLAFNKALLDCNYKETK